jgi:hypothetical protein
MSANSVEVARDGTQAETSARGAYIAVTVGDNAKAEVNVSAEANVSTEAIMTDVVAAPEV